MGLTNIKHLQEKINKLDVQKQKLRNQINEIAVEFLTEQWLNHSISFPNITFNINVEFNRVALYPETDLNHEEQDLFNEFRKATWKAYQMITGSSTAVFGIDSFNYEDYYHNTKVKIRNGKILN